MDDKIISIKEITENVVAGLVEGQSIQVPDDPRLLSIPVKGSVPCFAVYNVPNGSMRGRALAVFVNDNLVMSIDYNDEGGLKQNIVNLGGFLKPGANDLRLVTVLVGICNTTVSFTVLSEGSTIITTSYPSPGGFNVIPIDLHWQLDFTP